MKMSKMLKKSMSNLLLLMLIAPIFGGKSEESLARNNDNDKIKSENSVIISNNSGEESLEINQVIDNIDQIGASKQPAIINRSHYHHRNRPSAGENNGGVVVDDNNNNNYVDDEYNDDKSMSSVDQIKLLSKQLSALMNRRREDYKLLETSLKNYVKTNAAKIVDEDIRVELERLRYLYVNFILYYNLSIDC